MNYEIVPSLKCFRCCFLCIDDSFDCLCLVLGLDISDYILDFPFDCSSFVSEDNLDNLIRL